MNAISLSGDDYDEVSCVATGLDATLDQAKELLHDVDLSGVDPKIQQACALLDAAEHLSGSLLKHLGLHDADEDGEDDEYAKYSNLAFLSTLTVNNPSTTSGSNAITSLLYLASSPRTYDTATRQAYAKKGIALPDGSYPIPDRGALEDAIHALGRGKNNPKAEIKAHIIKRARALGATDLIPDDWK